MHKKLIGKNDGIVSKINMDIKYATLLGVNVYFVIFAFSSIVTFYQINLQSVNTSEIELFLLLIAPIIVFLNSKYFYFNKIRPQNWKKDGLALGIYWAILNLILNIIIFIYILKYHGWDKLFTIEFYNLIYPEFIIFSLIAAYTSRLSAKT